MHAANTLKYDDSASQKLGGVRTDRAWKSEFAWSVCLDLCLTDRRWSVLFLSLFERSTEQWKAFISVHGGAPHTLVPCSVSAEGGYHAEAKTACPASGMPLPCTSPLLPPLKATLPNVSVSESPWHWYMRNSERAKVRRRVLVNKQDDQDTNTCTWVLTPFLHFSLFNIPFVQMLIYQFFQTISERS